MRLQDLLEMPNFVDKEAALGGIEEHNQVFDLKQFQENYKILVDREQGGNRVVVGLERNLIQCVAGIVQGNKVISMAVLQFHPEPDLGEAGKNALQVDTVQAKDDAKGTGFGYEVYKAILNAGYTLVSDHTQYRGGRALWEKIVRKAGMDGHRVLVLVNGKYMRGEDKKPIVYNGGNIDPNEIWGPKNSQHHYNVLLVAKNN